jgi:diguanylate cyclase (GGDEF)-like protein
MHAWALVCPASVVPLETLLSSSRSRLRLAPHDQLVQIVSRCTPSSSEPGAARASVLSVPQGGGASAVAKLTRETLRAIPNIALFMFDRDLRFLFCEGSSLRTGGFDPESMQGRTLREVLAARADALEPIYRRALAGETLEFETRVGDQSYCVRAAPTRDADGRVVGGSLLSVEVTDARSADRMRRESLERLDRIASNVPGAVYQARVDADGVISYPYISEGIRDVAGLDPEALRIDPSLFLEMIHPDDLDDFKRTTADAVATNSPSQWDGRIVLADDSVRWLRISTRPQATHDGSTVRDGVVIDRTAQRSAEESARWQLEHDALTGLPARRLFLDRLEQALLRRGSVVGVCIVDVDHLKQINDAFGHVVGDAVFRAISDRIRACLRAEDSVARHGGDDLAVLFPNLPSREFAIVLARRIAKVWQTPVHAAGRDIAFSCSIGVAVAPDDGLDAKQLLSRADAAMYRAKDHGRARVEVFNAELARENEERLWLECHLREAIERDELHLVYQPLVDTKGTCTSVEALLRWHPTGHDPIPPSVFVPIAEQIGLISTIGAWVLQRACETAAAWLTAGKPLRVCVNLSPCQLADSGIARFVATTLTKAGLPASLLELEVTETALMERGERVIAPLRELRGLGVRISLDDFGTGYSSLARLRHLPLDALKVDASFVAEIGQGFGTAVVATIIELGHTLGLDVIGEGVETIEQQRVLEALGCDQLQGYLLGRPAPDVPAAPSSHRHAA